MTHKELMKRRNELAYLALYYAIIGKKDMSTRIRKAVHTLENRDTGDQS